MKNFGAQNMVTSIKKVLMKKPQKYMSKVNLEKWNYKYPLNQKIVEKNYDEFFNIIKSFDAEIFELDICDEDELCDSIFTHDPSLILNEGALILNMGKKLRTKETIEHENIVCENKIIYLDKEKN